MQIKEHSIYKCKVSTQGDIISPTGKILFSVKNGYNRIAVRRRDDNQIKHVFAHRLVCETFIGEIPKGFCINHKDGNKINNDLINLEIVSFKENTIHAVKNGFWSPKKGKDHWNSCLMQNEIEKMYELFEIGISNKEISKIFNINFRTVSQIRSGCRWKEQYDKFGMNITPTKYTSVDIKTAMCIIKDIDSKTFKNIELSKKYNLDASMISRIKNKQTWINLWKIYNRSATTIPTGSTFQVYGNGKAENPEKDCDIV